MCVRASECYLCYQYVLIFINPIRKKGMQKAKNVLDDMFISMVFMGTHAHIYLPAMENINLVILIAILVYQMVSIP